MDFRLPHPLKYSLKKKKTRWKASEKDTKKLSLKHHNKNASCQTDSSESSDISNSGSAKKNNDINTVGLSIEVSDCKEILCRGDVFRPESQCAAQGNLSSNIYHFCTPARRKVKLNNNNVHGAEELGSQVQPSCVNLKEFHFTEAIQSSTEATKSKGKCSENSVISLDTGDSMSELSDREALTQKYSSGSGSSRNASAEQNRTILLSDSDTTLTSEVLKMDENLKSEGRKVSDSQNSSTSGILFDSSLLSDHISSPGVSVEFTKEKRMANVHLVNNYVSKTGAGKKSIFRSSALHKKFNNAVETDLAVCSSSDFYMRVKNRVLGLHKTSSESSAAHASDAKTGSNSANWDYLDESEEDNKENIGGNTPGSKSMHDNVRKRNDDPSRSRSQDFQKNEIFEENSKIIVPDSDDSSDEVPSPIPKQKSVDLINKVDSKRSVFDVLKGDDKSNWALEEDVISESSNSEKSIPTNPRRPNHKVKKKADGKGKTLEKKDSESEDEYLVPESDDSSIINDYQRKRGVFVIKSSDSESSASSASDESDGIEVIKEFGVDCVARNITSTNGSNHSSKIQGTLEYKEYKSGSSDLLRRVTKRALILESSESVNKTSKDQDSYSSDMPCQKENELPNIEFQPGFSTLSQSKHEDIKKWLTAIPCHPETDEQLKTNSKNPIKTPRPKPKGGEDENITLTDMQEVLDQLYGKDWGDRRKFTPKVVPKTKESKIIIARLTDSDDSSTPPLPASTPKKRLFNKNNHIFTPRGDFTPAAGSNIFTPLSSIGKKGGTSVFKTPRTVGSKSKIDRACLQSGAFSSPVLTFLASLSVGHQSARCHPEAAYYLKNFKSKKEELAVKLFRIFNKDVFSSKLPHDMPILWNNRLRKTAGYCYNRKVKNSEGTFTRTSRIELSSKIVDNAGRLRDTLIHELCHAATWIISEVMGGHGPCWKRWTNKAMAAFPELPAISRCHNYDIVTKYRYQCTVCSYSIGRHSKSLDTERKVCGICGGKFELFLNAKDESGKTVPRTPRSANNFALFVKDNYKDVKGAQSDLKHKDIMKMLSERFAATKISSQTTEGNDKEKP